MDFPVNLKLSKKKIILGLNYRDLVPRYGEREFMKKTKKQLVAIYKAYCLRCNKRSNEYKAAFDIIDSKTILPEKENIKKELCEYLDEINLSDIIYEYSRDLQKESIERNKKVCAQIKYEVYHIIIEGQSYRLFTNISKTAFISSYYFSKIEVINDLKYIYGLFGGEKIKQRLTFYYIDDNGNFIVQHRKQEADHN